MHFVKTPLSILLKPPSLPKSSPPNPFFLINPHPLPKKKTLPLIITPHRRPHLLHILSLWFFFLSSSLNLNLFFFIQSPRIEDRSQERDHCLPHLSRNHPPQSTTTSPSTTTAVGHLVAFSRSDFALFDPVLVSFHLVSFFLHLFFDFLLRFKTESWFYLQQPCIRESLDPAEVITLFSYSSPPFFCPLLP